MAGCSTLHTTDTEPGDNSRADLTSRTLGWGPLEATQFGEPRHRTLYAARARAKDTRSPAFAPSAMEELRRHRDTVREAVTRGVAAIQLLLQDPLSSTAQIGSHLHAVDSRYEELKSLDKRIYEETIDLDDLEADLFDSYEYDEKVVTIHTLVYFARPSAVPSPVAAGSTGAPNYCSAVIRYGNTVVPSGESRIAAEAVKVANVPAACEPCVSDCRNVLTAADECDQPERTAESTTASIEANLGVPSRPPCGDCVVVQDGHETDLSKDPMTTINGDADPSSVMFSDASDIAAARGGSLQRERVVKYRERPRRAMRTTVHSYRIKRRLNHEESQSIRRCKEPQPKIARYITPTPELSVVGLSLPTLNKTGTRKLHHSSKHRWKRKHLGT